MGVVLWIFCVGVGRGCGVGRGLGDGIGLGVTVTVAVAVGVGVGEGPPLRNAFRTDSMDALRAVGEAAAIITARANVDVLSGRQVQTG